MPSGPQSNRQSSPSDPLATATETSGLVELDATIDVTSGTPTEAEFDLRLLGRSSFKRDVSARLLVPVLIIGGFSPLEKASGQ
jgi:hypothetical protein